MNIYVSNLSFNTGDVELNELFSAHGEVASAKVITDRETGRSRGFGFVEMNSDTEGNAAIEALNDTMVEGRNVAVAIAREKTERNGNGFNREGAMRSGYSNKKW